MATIEGTFEKSSSLKVAIVVARFNDLITNKIYVFRPILHNHAMFSNPKNKKYLDIIKFNLTVLNEGIKFIALGGINQKNINKVYLTKSVGIVGIRWIKKNGPRKILRPFLRF